jgi:hypothetical protein
MIKNIVVLLLAVGLSGCASNSYFLLKNHYFDSPEAKGEKFKFSVSAVPYQDVTTVQTSFDGSGPLGSVITVNNKDLAEDAVETFDNSSVLLSLSLLERLDISLDFAIGNQPNFLNLKYQFIGDTQAQAEAGNFSVAGVLGLGYIAVNEDNPESAFLDDFDVLGGALRVAGIVGLRSTKELLLYWSNSYSHFRTRTEYVFGVNEGDFTISGHQFLTTLGAEYTFDEKICVGIEYGFIFADADNTESNSFASFATKIGYNF